MGVEQHLVGLQRIGPHQKRPAVRQLDMGNLQLDPFATNVGPVFAPVELESLAGLKHQRNVGAASRRLRSPMPVRAPRAGKSRHASVGTIIAKLHQISMHLLQSSAFLARLACLHKQPGGQTIRIRVQLARTCWRFELRLSRAFAKVLSDGVARQASAPGNLADWHLVTQCPASDDTQKSHVDHSISPQPNPSGQRVHMGQFSVKIWGATGSLLSGNQHRIAFKTADMDVPLLTADDNLQRTLSVICENTLAQMPKTPNSVARLVERQITARLAAGTAQQDAIAAELGMSARTLARRLTDEGTSFAAVVANLRKALARD